MGLLAGCPGLPLERLHSVLTARRRLMKQNCTGRRESGLFARAGGLECLGAVKFPQAKVPSASDWQLGFLETKRERRKESCVCTATGSALKPQPFPRPMDWAHGVPRSKESCLAAALGGLFFFLPSSPTASLARRVYGALLGAESPGGGRRLGEGGLPMYTAVPLCLCPPPPLSLANALDDFDSPRSRPDAAQVESTARRRNAWRALALLTWMELVAGLGTSPRGTGRD